jgi:hypothetical protein
MKATPPKTTRQTFYFDTGVKPHGHTNPPYKLSAGHIIRGTVQIPFDCEVPENAFFKFACDNPEAGNGLFCAEILSGALVSKYAFFSLPVS